MRSPLLTYKQVAEICDVSESNVRKWVMSRQLKSYQPWSQIK